MLRLLVAPSRAFLCTNIYKHFYACFMCVLLFTEMFHTIQVVLLWLVFFHLTFLRVPCQYIKLPENSFSNL